MGLPDPIGVDQLLAEARSQLDRLSPLEASRAIDDGAALLDIRSGSQRARDGVIPGSAYVPRNVLEWRLDPTCLSADHALANADGLVILVCDEGYQSSLAAATLRRLGVDATDMTGGFQAWREAGLPVVTSSAPVAKRSLRRTFRWRSAPDRR